MKELIKKVECLSFDELDDEFFNVVKIEIGVIDFNKHKYGASVSHYLDIDIFIFNSTKHLLMKYLEFRFRVIEISLSNVSSMSRKRSLDLSDINFCLRNINKSFRDTVDFILIILRENSKFRRLFKTLTFVKFLKYLDIFYESENNTLYKYIKLHEILTNKGIYNTNSKETLKRISKLLGISVRT
jgi:hypothetical protein